MGIVGFIISFISNFNNLTDDFINNYTGFKIFLIVWIKLIMEAFLSNYCPLFLGIWFWFCPWALVICSYWLLNDTALLL